MKRQIIYTLAVKYLINIQFFSSFINLFIHLKKVAVSGMRHLTNNYRLTDRSFIGTTSMDPELSFLSANMAWVK